HQPHPPGYPVFILLAKAMHLAVPSELTALALVSVVSGALGVVAIAWLFVGLDGRTHDPAEDAGQGRDGQWVTWLPPTIVAITAPLYWFTAARPLSDTAGLAAAVAVQALTLGARTPAVFAGAALAAGIATGLRSQVAWLTVPLLIVTGLGARGWRLAVHGEGPRAPGWGPGRKPEEPP